MSISNEETMLLIFGVCHLCAMSSVCSNPIMYGFINQNFKKVRLKIDEKPETYTLFSYKFFKSAASSLICKPNSPRPATHLELVKMSGLKKDKEEKKKCYAVLNTGNEPRCGVIIL